MTTRNQSLEDILSNIVLVIKSNGTVTYYWSGLTATFGALTLQDWGFIIGVGVGVVYTIRNYRVNKRQKLNAIKRDNEKAESIARQTKLIEEYLLRVREEQPNKDPMEAVEEVLTRCALMPENEDEQ